ncbi:MAG: ADP-forming succinate--CoA ligase subunit beta [Anaerolineales bacterium]|nr:ADP-forming succinate--CoA ligase subunit beta [Anaerolineales bacterium]
MKLHEYISKRIFADYGIPIPEGKVAKSPHEAKQIAEEIGGQSIVKSQVLVGGRGKAGGIRLAETPAEAQKFAQEILGMEIKGLPVRKVLVDRAVQIQDELYLGVTNDRAARKPVMMASAEGGVNIEEVAERSPEKIIQCHIDPVMGIQNYQARDLAAGIDLSRELWRSFGKITHGLWEAYVENDATLAEINPLVVTADQKLLAVDGKMVIDDNALFRHPDLEELRDLDLEADSEIEARKHGLSYIKLDGDIGCMVNGAGLAMTTMDIIKLFGGEPANFLDIGGGASAEKVTAALNIILTDQNVKAVLFNIFGGITRCDMVAQGILDALQEVDTDVPMIVRLVGTNAREGRELLKKAEMKTADTLAEAAKMAVAAAKG